MSSDSESRVPLRAFVTDSALFGIGAMADKLIAFVFLPITAGILGTSGFGVFALYSTAATILFMLCSLGMPSAYFRFATDDSIGGDENATLSVAFVTLNLASVLWIAAVLPFAGPISSLAIGVDEPWFVYWLCLRTYTDLMASLADCHLQAAGKVRLFLALRVPATVFIRVATLIVLIQYRSPLALAAGEAMTTALSSLPVSMWVMREVRLNIDRRLARTMLQYGVTLVPGMLSAWALIATNRYLIKAFSPDGVRDVGLYSLGERFSSMILLVGQTLWLGWRRFGFRNMHRSDGPQMLSRGLTLYALVASLATLGVVVLAPGVVYLWMKPEFWPAIPTILPLSLAAFCGAIANPLRMGLTKEQRTMTISLLIAFTAVVNVALAVPLILSSGSFGASVATLVGQVVGVLATYKVGQRYFPLPIEKDRLFKVALYCLAVYGVGQLGAMISPLFGLALGAIALCALPFALFYFGPLSPQERATVEQALRNGWAMGAALLKPR
ncbi:MAG: oligosaccharide flippase family protein [Bryobacterales bacterium]